MKFKRNMVVAVSVWGLFVVVFSGLSTNWFRYGPTLETGAMLLLLGGATVVILGFFAVFLIKGYSTSIPLIGMETAALLLILVVNRSVTGQVFPALHVNDLASSPEQKLVAWRHLYKYHLVLINPFSKSHKEILVIAGNEQAKEISIPLFVPGKPVGAYTGPAGKGDWISLIPTSKQGSFILETSGHLKRGTFKVDFTDGVATELTGGAR